MRLSSCQGRGRRSIRRSALRVDRVAQDRPLAEDCPRGDAQILAMTGIQVGPLTLKNDVSVGDLATAAAVVIAVVALLLGWYQLRGLTRQTRATALLALDERWEGAEMAGARADLERVIRAVQAEAVRRSTPQNQVSEIDVFPEALEELRRLDPGRHTQLLRICGFFETTAYAAREHYLKTSDLHRLFGVSIRDSGFVFHQHIMDLQTRWGVPKLFEHYVWLLDEVRKRDTRRWWQFWRWSWD